MPKAKKGGQAHFEDVILNDDELPAHIETFLETQEAASNNAAAKRKIRDIVPAVDKRTRFVVGELYIIEAAPYSRKASQVRAGQSQRLRVKEATEA